MKSVLFALVFFLTATPASGSMEFSNADVRAVSTTEFHVKFSWKLDVASDKPEPTCKIHVSLRDKEGFEVHGTDAWVIVSQGDNHFTGTDICTPDVWRQVHAWKFDLFLLKK